MNSEFDATFRSPTAAPDALGRPARDRASRVDPAWLTQPLGVRPLRACRAPVTSRPRP